MHSLLAHDYEVASLERICVHSFGFDLYVTPRFRQRYEEAAYEELTSSLMRQVAKGAAAFLDVGAHYGFFSVLVGRSNPRCSIVAFEPVPENAEILRRNIELNAVAADVRQAAVSSAPGLQKFQISAASDSSGFVANPGAEVVQRITVDAVRLDDLLGSLPDGALLVKIDVEGHELRVLEGMRRILDEREDVRLVVEFNPRCLAANATDPAALLATLEELGFVVYFVLDRERLYTRHVPGGDWMEEVQDGATLNLFCVRKKLALSICVFSHLANLGGAERSLLELVESMSRRWGTLFHVLLPGDGPLQPKLEALGAAVTMLDYGWWCWADPPKPAVAERNLALSCDRVSAALPLLSRFSPDAVLTSSLVIPWGAITALQLDCPHVWWVKEYGELDHGLRFWLPFDQTLRIVEESSAHVLVNSRSVKETLFPRSREQRCSVATNLVTLNPVEGTAVSYYGHQDSVKLAICGYVAPSKGQEDAVRAVAALCSEGHDVELCVAGTMRMGEPYARRLLELVESFGLQDRVHFLGELENVRPLLDQAHVCLTCSRREAYGRVTAEAMLAGKPVIGTNTGGTPELVREGTDGFLYPPGDIARLAECITYFVQNPEASAVWGRRAQAGIAEHLAMNGVDERVFEIGRKHKRDRNELSPELVRLLLHWQLQLRIHSGSEPGPHWPRETELLQEVEEVKSQLADVYASTSWHLTAPMRRVRDALRVWPWGLRS